MDIALSSIPAVSQGYSSPGRSDAVQYREAVRTELPATQAVTASGGSSGQQGVTSDQGETEKKAQLLQLADQIHDNLKSRYEKDSATGDLVYRSIDMTSGEVVFQYPDERAMRLRALLKEMQGKQKITDDTADLKSGTLLHRSA